MTTAIPTNYKFSKILVVTALLFAILVSSCKNENTSPANNESTFEKIKRTKELNVGYFVLEPTIMEDPNSGKLTGVFIDLTESIAKSLNAKIIYHKVDLANFAAGLQSHQFDICVGCTFSTPQRATAVAFTRPLFYSGYVGVTNKGQSEKYKDWKDLDKPELKVAVKQGSAIDDFVRENFKNAKVIRLAGPDLSLPLAAVSSGQADVGLMNQQTVFTYLREHKELEEVLPDNPIAPTNYSWSTRQDDISWLNYINTCLEYLENTGAMYQYEQKYGIPLLHSKIELVYPTTGIITVPPKIK